MAQINLPVPVLRDSKQYITNKNTTKKNPPALFSKARSVRLIISLIIHPMLKVIFEFLFFQKKYIPTARFKLLSNFFSSKLRTSRFLFFSPIFRTVLRSFESFILTHSERSRKSRVPFSSGVAPH